MKKINFINETNYDTKEFEKQILFTLEFVEEEDFIVNIIFVTSKKIQEINKFYRKKDAVTDVISFANREIEFKVLNPYNEIGDIFICIDRAIEQSKEYGHTLIREIVFLAVHGYLHLNGFDHMTKEDEKVMINKQKNILELANIRK